MDMDMDMVMGLIASFDEELASMSPAGSSATSCTPTTATAPPAAVVTGSSDDDEAAAAAAVSALRRGPWTVDEDILLVNYIAAHGEGRWNSLARSAGLRRTGKSCRLRWLNYLRPDVRRGNITAGEQLRILELHARWGNRWSKIAAHLPGRTDNEIKNYWRTRVQKHASHLRCHVNSAQFRHVVRSLWMPRLRERALADRQDLQLHPAAAAAPVVQTMPATTTASAPPACYNYYGNHYQPWCAAHHGVPAASEAHRQYYSEPAVAAAAAAGTALSPDDASSALRPPPSSHYAAAYAYTSAAMATSPTTMNDDHGCGPTTTDSDDVFAGVTWSELLATTATAGGPDDDFSSMSMVGKPEFGFGDLEDGLWNLDDLCLLQQPC